MAMRASGKVLVDTSAWIEFFRKSEPCYTTVSHLLTDDKVCSAGIILAELLQGAKSDKEISILKDFIDTFSLLPDSPGMWIAAGELSNRLRRKGITIGLADCYIAMIALEADVHILSLDSHFERIRKETDLNLSLLKS